MAPPRTNVRLATPRDVTAVLAVDDEVSAGDARRIAFIRRAVPLGQCVVCTRGRRIVGYAVVDYEFYGHGFVWLLYVHRDHRRTGVATRLMRQVESACETEKLFTSTNVSNIATQSLLVKLGYRWSGVIDNLDPGDPELVYFKRLAHAPAGG